MHQTVFSAKRAMRACRAGFQRTAKRRNRPARKNRRKSLAPKPSGLPADCNIASLSPVVDITFTEAKLGALTLPALCQHFLTLANADPDHRCSRPRKRRIDGPP